MLILTEGSFPWWTRLGLEYPELLTIALVAVFAVGSCFGSFLNVCIWRLPLGESIVSVPSHCTKCGYEIRWYDNIPIFSYLVLRGRCRNCREPYSPRYLIVEALTGALFVAVFLKVGLTSQPPAMLALYWVMVMLCVTTSWIDVEHRLIPDATTLPALLFGLAVGTAFPSTQGCDTYPAALLRAAAGAAIPGILLTIFTIAGRLAVRREVLGWGDVKFAAAAGALLGAAGALFCVATGALAGTVYGIALALTRKRSMKHLAIPFGPFLAGGALVWIFFGEKVLRWYLSLLRLAQ